MQASAGFDSPGAAIDMLQVELLELPQSMATSVALTRDILQTANRVAISLGQPAPFRVGAPSAHRRPRGAPRAHIVPGVGCVDGDELARFLTSPDAVDAVRRVRAAEAEGALHVASCAGVALLAEAGVLDGRRATTSWFLHAAMARRYPKVRFLPDAMVVDDGPCLTGAAALAQGDVMLALVRRVASPEVADLTARYLLLDERPSQAPYLSPPALATNDPLVRRAEHWIRWHLHRPFGVAELADALGLPPWTLARRLSAATGLSPSRLAQHIRADDARRRLARGDRAIDVAHALGFSDASALRRLLKRHGGTTD